MWLLSQFLEVDGVLFYLTSWKKDSWIKMGFTRKVNTKTTFLVFRAFLCQTTVIFKWRHKTWRGGKVFRGEFYAEAKSWREIPEISDTRLLARWRLLHCGQNICGRARFPEISSLHSAKILQNSVNWKLLQKSGKIAFTEECWKNDGGGECSENLSLRWNTVCFKKIGGHLEHNQFRHSCWIILYCTFQ